MYYFLHSLCVEFITLLWRMEKKKLVKIIPRTKIIVKIILKVKIIPKIIPRADQAVSKNFGL